MKAFFTHFSIDELKQAKRNTEKYFKQFKTIETRSKRLSKDIKNEEYTVYTPFRLAYFEDEWVNGEGVSTENIYLVGGRHRLRALEILLEDDSIDESFFTYKCTLEPTTDSHGLLKLVINDNGSRSCTGAELAGMKYHAEDYQEGDVLDRKGSQELKDMGAKHYKVAECIPDITQETTFKVWKRVINQLNKLDKKFVKVISKNGEAQVRFAEIFKQEASEYFKNASGNVSREYCKHADKLAEIISVYIDEFSSYKLESKKHLTEKDREMFDRLTLPTDIDSLKKRHQSKKGVNNDENKDETESDEFDF